MKEATQIEALRRAFQHPSPAVPECPSDLPPGSCPDPDTLWEAANGGLALLDRYRVVDHLTQCAECTLAWRLATDLQQDDKSPLGKGAIATITGRIPRRRPREWQRMLVPLISAAAAVVLAVGLMFFHDDRIPDAPVITRGAPAAQAQLDSPEDDEVVSRDEFVLTWTPGPAGTTYDVQVLTEDLGSILIAIDDLQSNNLEIPEDVLAGLAPGTEVVWSVDATLPSGGSTTGTFSSIVQ